MTTLGFAQEVDSIATDSILTDSLAIDTTAAEIPVQSFQFLNDYFSTDPPLKMMEKPTLFVGGWFFIINIILVLLMILKYLFYPEYVKNSWNALINQNLFFQFIRGKQAINMFLFIVEFCFKIYLISLIVIIGAYLINKQWLLNFQNFKIIFLGLSLFFSVKALVAFLLSIITENWKEFKAMSIINIVFVSNLSWLLVPLLCIVVYMNFQIRPYAVYTLLTLVAIAFIIYIVKGISVLRKIRMNLNMHFFIYLCAFEIVPYLILSKVLYNFKYIF
ncbi:MAG: DUF4271 domain-containing protein [Chitinophagales bacterium]